MRISSLVPATAMFWQPAPGQSALVVIAKLTFVLEPGTARVAPEHDALTETDRHWDDDPARFLVTASDLVPSKPRVDVLYVGRAIAGSAAAPAVARLSVGRLDKRIEARREHWPELGPIALVRRALPEVAAWARAWTESPMPEGSSTALFNCAPADQQLDELTPGIEILLENLAPGAPNLRCVLPAVAPRAEVELDRGRHRVALRADTLHIDGHRGVATVVWRGQVAGITAAQAKSLAVELDVPAAAEPLLTRSSSRTAPVARDSATGRALPFRGGPPGAAPPPQAWAPNTSAGHTYVPGMGAAAPTAVGAWQPPAYNPAPAPPPPPVAAPPVVAPVVAAPLHHSPLAARGGLGAISDAAADPTPPVRNAIPAARPTAATRPTRGVRLLWHDPDRVLEIRQKPEWKIVLAKRERRVPERSDAHATADAEDAGEMAAILLGAPAASETALTDAVRLGLDDEGLFRPELHRIDGELALELDDVALLAALVATATACAPDDAAVKRALEVATAFASAPGDVSPAGMARGLADKLRVAWRDWKTRPFDVARLDEIAARAVLEKRAYARRDVFGAVHVRAGLRIEGSDDALVAYLPEAAAKQLPLYLRVSVRAIVEVHPREDETEASLASLRVLVLGRVLGDAS